MKNRKGLLVGIVSFGIAIILLVVCVIKFVNFTGGNSGISLERNYFECSKSEVCDNLDDNIVSIKNIVLSKDDKVIKAIILDKEGYIYLKFASDVVKLDGKTKLKRIDYVLEVTSSNWKLIVYDENGVYYIDIENYVVIEHKLSSDIKYLIDYSSDDNFSIVNNELEGYSYYSCNNMNCQDGEDWYNEKIDSISNVMYANGRIVFMNDKLYKKNILENKKIMFEELLDNVDKVWSSLTNIKSNTYMMALTKDNELYMIDVNSSMVYRKFNIDFVDEVKDVYFISAGFYGRAVVVGNDKVSLISSNYNDNSDVSVEVKDIDNISKYINKVKDFYSEDNKLFVLLDDGNVYLVRDFEKSK